MNKLYLYRIKVIEKEQLSLFQSQNDRSKFISNIINEKPSYELRKGYIWHVGNVKEIKPDGILFAVGRTTKTSREKYDPNTGNFIEIEGEESPFTYAVYDTYYSIIGIAPKSRLAPKTIGIAKQIERLFNNYSSVKNQGVRIDITEISDPRDFIYHIQTAYAVTSFTAEFGEPNPWDVEEDFHKPMEKYLKETGGQNGKTLIKGDDLDRDKLEKVTRSVASTGNNAKARIKQTKDHKGIVKNLKGDSVQITFSEDDKDETGLIQRLRNAYKKVRG